MSISNFSTLHGKVIILVYVYKVKFYFLIKILTNFNFLKCDYSLKPSKRVKECNS